MADTGEKLLELLQSDDCPLILCYGGMERLVNYLIANGVTLQKAGALIQALKGQRDAALGELKQMGGCGACVSCHQDYDAEPCDSCRQDSRFPNWKWRGPDGQA